MNCVTMIVFLNSIACSCNHSDSTSILKVKNNIKGPVPSLHVTYARSLMSFLVGAMMCGKDVRICDKEFFGTGNNYRAPET